jgi:hypothetical protein
MPRNEVKLSQDYFVGIQVGRKQSPALIASAIRT